MEAKKVWSELFEKEVKKVEGLGLAGVGRKRVEEVKGMAREGEPSQMQNGVLTVQIESDQKREKRGQQLQSSRTEGKSWRVGRSQGSTGPLYYSGMNPLRGGQVNDAKCR